MSEEQRRVSSCIKSFDMFFYIFSHSNTSARVLSQTCRHKQTGTHYTIANNRNWSDAMGKISLLHFLVVVFLLASMRMNPIFMKGIAALRLSTVSCIILQYYCGHNSLLSALFSFVFVLER